jgi:hypothetical protein
MVTPLTGSEFPGPPDPSLASTKRLGDEHALTNTQSSALLPRSEGTGDPWTAKPSGERTAAASIARPAKSAVRRSSGGSRRPSGASHRVHSRRPYFEDVLGCRAEDEERS